MRGEIKLSKISPKIAYLGIICFGLISLAGDIIYEGARSVIPQYLYFLGAPAIIVGSIIGLGEFFGYGLRLLSGILADIFRRYWLFTFIGYLLLIAVPLMAFTGNWQLALILILIERFAKAIRSPARDTLISHISSSVGTGKAFGIHELMDQIGAIGGPAIVAATLYLTGGIYSQAFIILFIPYLLLVLALMTAYIKLKTYTRDLTGKKGAFRKLTVKALPLEFKLYSIAVLINTAGLIHISLILYKAAPQMVSWLISIIYLAAQAIDATIAPIAGLTYDKIGRKTLIIPFILSILPSILTLTGQFNLIILAALTFGIILGMQESIYRAAVSDLSSTEYRGLAYGIFYVSYGIGFIISGAIFGYFLDYKLFIPATIYTIIMQVIATIILIKSLK